MAVTRRDWSGSMPPELLDELRRMLRVLRVVAVLGGGALWPYPFAMAGLEGGLAGIGASLGLLSLGGVVGFLFAFPKSFGGAAAQGPVAGLGGGKPVKSPVYVASTHLEEIASLLTKTMVGVTLVGFQQYVAPGLTDVATNLASALGGGDSSLAVAWAYLGFFGLFGFIGVFMVSRLYLGAALRIADREDAARDEGANLTIGRLKAQLMTGQPEPTQASGAGASGESARVDMVQRIADAMDRVRPPSDPVWNSDPHRGRFGGRSARDGWKLTAQIEPLGSLREAACRVLLKVSATADLAASLQPADEAEFYLHPTFPNTIERRRMMKQTAELKIVSAGVFTVGAVAPDGTRLELNLADEPGGTTAFYEN